MHFPVRHTIEDKGAQTHNTSQALQSHGKKYVIRCEENHDLEERTTHVLEQTSKTLFNVCMINSWFCRLETKRGQRPRRGNGVAMATKYMRATESSGDAFASETLRLTKDFIRHLNNRNFDWCLNKTTKDFMWVGTQKDYVANSQAAFSEFLDNEAPNIKQATIADEEYSVVLSTERFCTIAGRFLVITQSDSDKVYTHWNRCTFVWQRVGRRTLLAHLHVSTPVGSTEEGDVYPIAAGAETYKYMQSLRRLGSSRKIVSLYDVDGTVHWVHPSQIIYLEASRKRTIVHCMTKDIVVPAVIRDAVEMVDNKIMRVHRSYAVNRDHIVELKAGRLLLDDGTSIVIPAKRIADVRAELTGH